MDFRIADTFTSSLARLTSDEQRAVKVTAFDLQANPANPGMSFHKLERVRDKRFWSVRVNDDIRLIVHRTDASLLLCYVDHHDAAYRWAERRKLEVHPKTGAAQLVEIRETVREIAIPVYVDQIPSAAAIPRLFADVAADDLLAYGVPEEWLADVQQATEDTLFTLADHLPAEAAEALLELATGGQPKAAEAVTAADPFAHPDAQRRFRVMTDVAELERALEYPWEQWTVFLHPAQRDLVERDYSGPARISGSAGTGKTVVALHRAVELARRHPEARVLLTTFSDALSKALQVKLRRLLGNEPALAERIEVAALPSVANRLYTYRIAKANIISESHLRTLLEEAASEVGKHGFSLQFLWTEWQQVVDAWNLRDWEAYQSVVRLGRKTRLPQYQREVLWTIFSELRTRLISQGWLTEAELLGRLTDNLTETSSPYDYVVVDEAQDVSVAQLRLLAALGSANSDSLFFTGDLGQRIFQQPFSWRQLGIDIRGRSHILRVNYRTSHQIRMYADRLLGPSITDVDGFTENRKGTVSVFNGPMPIIKTFDSIEDEVTAVATWLSHHLAEGVAPHEMAVFVRSEMELERARKAIRAAELTDSILDQNLLMPSDKVVASTMHLAKGLEFRCVAVMACDDEVIPQQQRIESVAEVSDLEEVYNTERHLLYVSCTRARDDLLVTGVAPESEFLQDLLVSDSLRLRGS